MISLWGTTPLQALAGNKAWDTLLQSYRAVEIYYTIMQYPLSSGFLEEPTRILSTYIMLCLDYTFISNHFKYPIENYSPEKKTDLWQGYKQ